MAYKVFPQKNEYKICGPLVLLFKISRIFGLAPVKLTSRGLKIYRPYIIYSRLIMTVLNATIVTGVAMDIADPETSIRAHSLSSKLIWICNVSILIALTSVGCIGAPERLECAINVIDRIEKINCQMGRYIRRDPTERVQYAALFAFTIGTSVLILIDFHYYITETIQHKFNIKVLATYSMFYVEFFIQLLLELQFSLTAVQLRNAFKVCNDELQNLVEKISPYIDGSDIERNEENNDENKIISVKYINNAIDTLYKNFGKIDKKEKLGEDSSETVRVIAQVYETICDLKQDINKVYGSLLILLLISFFLYLVTTPYYIITYLQYTTQQTGTMLLQTVWLTFHGLNLMLVMEPCHYTQKEMDRTRVLASQLLRRAYLFSDNLYDELSVFCKMLLLRDCHYSPFGMFILGRPLIVTILGAVTTYLVIIFQFRA